MSSVKFLNAYENDNMDKLNMISEKDLFVGNVKNNSKKCEEKPINDNDDSDYKTTCGDDSSYYTETDTVYQNINIFRYNFNDAVMEYLSTFAKIHQHDERKTYKEAWKLWLEENIEMIKREEKRLYDLGYEGDVIDKMYKAARYYFRKKSNVKPDPKKRRKYISMEHEILIAMDTHISRNMTNDDYTPSNGYSNFCQMHFELLKSNISHMLENKISKEEISVKFKKTYKNRYFILSRSNLNN
jgi:hypothetical protein